MFGTKKVSGSNLKAIKQRIEYLEANDPYSKTLKLLNLIVSGEQKGTSFNNNWGSFFIPLNR